MHTRELYTLGEPTLQRTEVESMQTCSAGELAAEAVKYREQRRAACPAGSKSRRRDMPEINDELKQRAAHRRRVEPPDVQAQGGWWGSYEGFLVSGDDRGGLDGRDDGRGWEDVGDWVDICEV